MDSSTTMEDGDVGVATKSFALIGVTSSLSAAVGEMVVAVMLAGSAGGSMTTEAVSHESDADNRDSMPPG
ncbi:unnamed protein product [Linum trigynum]|uniref:Uncharacterized protein n=1 Tax=Linum trigynum TaxID=586398 RepID=A0AAV2DWF7_9ROSI